MAFQLTDDLLDFTSTDDALGKGAGVDLLGGKVTLPLIDLIAHQPSARDMVQTVMHEGGYESVRRDELMERVSAAGSIARARALADTYADAARQNLELLQESQYSEALKAIPTYVLDRDR